ncbi:hypothetical protein HQO42_15095 [Rhodococcus fascians]|nr:hypothetical protein [Rhodococcus fascians]MBY4237781.1 hypothetical protein [Rhodococcus fascians]MBY4253984.1 hypothetical protein [Rhodococcus fascians]MBY4269145.1 hypothetical protein [Rhodococcus fascians]
MIGTKFGSDETEAGIRNKIKGSTLGGFAGAQNLFGGLFAGIAQSIAQMNMVIDEQVTQAGEITDNLTSLENRIEVLEGGAVTVRTYAFNEVWTKPEGLIRLGVSVEGGGDSGRTGSTVAANIGGTGGMSGGYRFEWFEKAAIDNDIAATEQITIGAGGNIPSQLGGVSKFGDHVTSVPGVGAILSVEGAVTSNSVAGPGGHGGNGVNGNTGVALTGGEPGGGSAFGAGGAGGSTAGTRAGGNGADATISPTARGNGGSGGGGGGTGAAGSQAGKGGDGGFPSGAGGGGGGRSALTTTDGPGGLGADGRVILIEYTRVEG